MQEYAHSLRGKKHLCARHVNKKLARVKTTDRGTIHSDRNFGLAGENFDGERLGLAFLQTEVVPTAVSIHRVTPAGTCVKQSFPWLIQSHVPQKLIQRKYKIIFHICSKKPERTENIEFSLRFLIFFQTNSNLVYTLPQLMFKVCVSDPF